MMTDAALEAAKLAAIKLCNEGPFTGGWSLEDSDLGMIAQAAITAYLAQREAEGFVMVPVEPTEAMADATDNHDNYWGYACNGRPWGPEDCYRAMIAARPQP